MTFERSASGQSNRAIFLGVDYVCYVEGPEEADCGADIAFWKTVLNAVRPELKIWFVSRGGKPNLERLAQEIVESDISNVLVAMDADYSRLFSGRFIDDRRILYTLGYSWENDIFHSGLAVDLYAKLALSQVVSHEVESYIDGLWSDILKKTYWIMLADFFALARKTSVIPRDAPDRIISKNAAGEPLFHLRQARILIFQAKGNKKAGVSLPYDSFPQDPRNHLVGKVVALISRYILNASLRKFISSKTLTYEHHRDVALYMIDEMIKSSKAHPILNYYRSMLARV